jgi:hypothetical protein
VRRLFLGEGVALAFLGSVMGVIGGVLYAKAMLLGLTTVWRDAIGASSLKFFVTPGSLLVGVLASTLVAGVTLWLALRKQARQPAMQLLNAEGRVQSVECAPSHARRKLGGLTSAATSALRWMPMVGAAALVGWAVISGETSNAGVFFGAGSLVLLGGLALLSHRLQRSAGVWPAPASTGNQQGRAAFSAHRLAFRGLARRRSRSVATVALLASGTFLIVSIGVFRLDANRDATSPASGTGGFALIGEATVPVIQDLNSASGRDFFALNERDLDDVDFVQFRVREGDDASCLNLNRAQKPRLLGVNPGALEGRFTFAKVAKGLEADAGWRLLNVGQASRLSSHSQQDAAIVSDASGDPARLPHDLRTGGTPILLDEVPAIGDLNSILWAMGKQVGDTLDYVDDRGRSFKVRLVGAVANSILQGNLLIDEAEFVKRFPNESGYQHFLLDAPPDRARAVAAKLTRTMEDYGVQLTPAAERLNQFNAVQNTYLGTFQMLGGLGLLLGSAGLGIVVLRNVLERRGELAVLLALGFLKSRVQRLVLIEHAALLGAGLLLGLVAAAVAVLPSLLSPGAQLPYATLVPTLLAVLLNGLLWTWLATATALRGDLLRALRNE